MLDSCIVPLIRIIAASSAIEQQLLSMGNLDISFLVNDEKDI